jgi:cell wall-associated NlpC family hydrolase
VSASFDRRITAARPDLAAAHLKGIVESERYVEGRVMQVVRSTAPLRAAPNDIAVLETELLFGETLTIYDLKDGWAWGQGTLDSYVGYVPENALAEVGPEPTHRVTEKATALVSAPDREEPPIGLLPMNAKLHVVEKSNRLSRLSSGYYVCSDHIATIDTRANDWPLVAAAFIGSPYKWGGKTALGIDCSGLVQTALEAAGIAAPRDADLMEVALGRPISLDVPLQRGDLVFWKGHMGAMLDPARFIHASGSAMRVLIEDFAAVRARILAEGNPIRTIKRLERLR